VNLSDSANAAPPDGSVANDYDAPRRRSFLKLGGATLLVGGAAASTAACGRTGTAEALTRETARMADSVQSDPSTSTPPDALTLVPIPPERIPAAVARLDSIIGNALSKTGVPGLAAAVVHDGTVLYAKGFGVRDVNSPARVDPCTVFHLASVSKPLSSTVVAGAVGSEALNWTDPIVAHLPTFALADPYVTEHVTYADLFSHLSGLPDHAGDLLEDLGYDQAYILNRLRLEPLGLFRANWEYTNFGLTAAAVAAAAATGQSWADLADEVLFGPVDMPSSSFRYSDFLNEANRAAMHVRVGTQWLQKYTRDADPEAPAGGASSNVLDLANWMIVQLASGTWKGNQVIGADALAQTHLPFALSQPPQSPISRSGFYGYGMNVSYDYAARLRFSHSGGFAQGAATAFWLLPSANLGIVVLTNGMPIGVPEAIINYFLDYVVAGSVQDDWLSAYGNAFAGMYVNPSMLAGKKPPENPVPANQNSFYTGTYDNPFYGPIQIVSEGTSLHLLIGPRPNDYVLQHWSGNLFSFYPTGENALGITAATFNPDATNSCAMSVTLEYYNNTGLGTFTR
jgi:CubicO group peptidase (beta-lactamase class C family)